MADERDAWVKVDDDGVRWSLTKFGSSYQWMKTDDLGTYRLTDWGVESKDPDGTWVNRAQMPDDVTHLTDAQIQRLVKELRGEANDDDEDSQIKSDFVPKAEVPPLEKWAFHGVDITDELKPTEADLKGFEQLSMTEDLSQAFFLSSRWKLLNEGRRHLGYSVKDTIEDIAYLNGCVIALKAMTEQLKRLVRYRKKIKGVAGADVPSDAGRLEMLRVDGLLGTAKGSAMAMWMYNPGTKRASIDIVVGDDADDMGPAAEAMTLRYVAAKAAELGAETVWCRCRMTESGAEFAPDYMRNLGFKRVPDELQEEEEWETFKFLEKEEIEEQIPSLNVWLCGRKLERHLDAVNAWCKEMGALDLSELIENKDDLFEYLGDALTEEERERLEQP